MPFLHAVRFLINLCGLSFWLWAHAHCITSNNS